MATEFSEQSQETAFSSSVLLLFFLLFFGTDIGAGPQTRILRAGAGA